MHLRKALSLAAFLAGSIPVGPALAEDLHLRYRVPAGCPSRESFTEQVARRTNKASWTAPNDRIRTFEVSVALGKDGVRGRLVILDPDSTTPALREVPGKSCDEVVGALALITALAIDPAATLAPLPQPQTPPEPRPKPKPRPRPEPKPKPRPEPKPKPPPTPEPPPATAPPSARWRWLLGVGAQATSGLGDKLAAVFPGYLGLAHTSSDWLAPSFRLGVSILPDRLLTHPLAQGQLSRITAKLSACPVKAEIAGLVLRPCASLEAGALIARGEGVDKPQTSANPWLAAGVGGRLQLFPIDWLLLEINGELGLSLIRPRFIVAPAIEVGTAAPIFGLFGGGLGVRFP